MTPEQYRAIRLRLGLSQRILARFIGVHPQTVSDRERGVKPIDTEAELAITHPKVTRDDK